MPETSRNHGAHDYAERIRERLPRQHQELREGMKLGVYSSRIEGGETILGVHVLARLALGLGVTLEKFFGGMGRSRV